MLNQIREILMKTRRHIFLLPLALIVFLNCPMRAPAQNFTLEQVTSSPFPTELTVSKRADKLAWAFDAEGKRNIWIAEGPAFAARQLTHYNSDDGQELTDFVFSPDGNAIAFVRGEGKNSAAEYPNPSSDPAGVKQQVIAVDTRTGRMTTIGEGSAPIFNPTGN